MYQCWKVIHEHSCEIFSNRLSKLFNISSFWISCIVMQVFTDRHSYLGMPVRNAALRLFPHCYNGSDVIPSTLIRLPRLSVSSFHFRFSCNCSVCAMWAVAATKSKMKAVCNTSAIDWKTNITTVLTASLLKVRCCPCNDAKWFWLASRGRRISHRDDRGPKATASI